jgi:hypothetical protein
MALRTHAVVASVLLAACSRPPLAQAPAPAAPPAPAAASPAPSSAPPAAYAAADEPNVSTVLLVSVDGLRSDALIAVPNALPGFERLRQGASTLNARADPDITVTLPNHTAMVTSRLFAGPEGHAWQRNDEVADGETIQSVRGSYVASVFDVVHDHGGWTGILCGKPKFHLFRDSWDAARGAPDTLPPDDGRNKVDRFLVDPKPDGLADAVIEQLKQPARAQRLLFVHFAVPDLTAHAKGWDVTPGSAYLKAVGEVDAALGRILDAIEGTDGLRGRTALILTADHGGGAPFKSHDQAHMWVDYVIPFLVWTGGAPRADLYALNPTTRRDPGLGRPRPGDGSLPPVRNADAGNLALDLLGLPAIPGSTVDAAQDLRAVVLPPG